MSLNPSDISKLAVAFSTPKGSEPLVALPLIFPMRWTNSGPAFCAATETITDFSNRTITQKVPQTPHPIDTLVSTMGSDVDDLQSASS